MLLRALRHGNDAVPAGLPWTLPNQLPCEVSLRSQRQGRGVKLGLTRRAEGTLHGTCVDKRPRSLQSRLTLPVAFLGGSGGWAGGGWGGGGWGGRQRQMAEQSVGHRMQLLHINRLSSQLERVPSFGLELRRNSSFISGCIERCECGGSSGRTKTR